MKKTVLLIEAKNQRRLESIDSLKSEIKDES